MTATSLDGRPPFSTTPPEPLTGEQLAARWQQSFPEALGPGCEDGVSGALSYGHEPDPRIGEIPHLLDPAIRDRENAERAARWNAMTPEQRAAMQTVEELVADALRRR